MPSPPAKPETAPPAPAEGMSYTLDKANHIVAVSGQWDAFALDNDGNEVLSSKIIGKPLDQFIDGDTTRMFVRTMIMSARTLQRPVYRPYRCDSPKLKRFMEMTVLPGEQGVVEVIHRELHSEPIIHPMPVCAAPKGVGENFVKRCSMCNRVKVLGIWSELDAAIDAYRLPAGAHNLKVIYGVCPDCLARRGVTL
jgi:hypothetical protein